MKFGTRLRLARERAGLTQKQVMEMTELNDKSLSRYENGVTNPDPATIAILCRLYDVSADYLIGLTMEMGHCKNGSSTAAPRILTDPDAHDLFESLSAASRKRVYEYIEMVKAYDQMKNDDD